MFTLIGNAFLALFAIDAGLSVLDECLKLWNLEFLAGVRNAVALSVVVALVPTYVLVAASPRLSARIFLPPILVGAWLALGAVPLQLAFEDPASFAMAASLIQLAVAALAYATVFARSGSRTALIESSAPGPAFAPLRFAGFAGGALVLGPPFLAAYLVLAAVTWIESGTAGFVMLDREGVHLSERHYQKQDREIRLVGMMHIGRRDVYERIFDSFELKSTVVLAEGVSDESHLLEAEISYRKLAEQLDLVVQERVSQHYPEAPDAWPHVLHRDMDVSDFSDETVEFLRLVGALADALDDPEAMLEKLQDLSQIPRAGETVMHDILTRRNERLLAEIEAALSDYERVVVPWGALHMPWIERGIERLGFERIDSRDHLFIDWDRILKAIAARS